MAIKDSIGRPITKGDRVTVKANGANGVVDGPTAGRKTLVDVWVEGSLFSFYGSSLMLSSGPAPFVGRNPLR